MKKKIYYGPETVKAVKNFHLSGIPVSLKIIYSLTKVKIAIADANLSLGRLDDIRHRAIMQAAREILAGKFDDQFLTDAIQGGAGTSINMNLNEVLAARASEILDNRHSGKKTPAKLFVHPLDHVNMGHSTNDAVPTALRVTLLELITRYSETLNDLEKSFRKKALQFSKVLKVGRTHLQDAVPVTLGQEFAAYASFLKRDRRRIGEIKKYLYPTNLGGTAIGTGINSSQKFIRLSNRNLSRLTKLPLKPASDLIDSTQNLDVFLHLASLLHVSAAGLTKICNDLRLMGSGPRAGLAEIILPEKQNGSSIMPGKINPVILESVNQICFQVSANTEIATLVTQNGQFELNVMLPVMIKSLLESFELLIRGLDNLRVNAIDGLLANSAQCQRYFDLHLGKATALVGKIGYDRAAALVKKAAQNETSLEEELIKTKLLSPGEIKKIFSPENLTRPKN
jgi:aspartate ammonia-lyase